MKFLIRVMLGVQSLALAGVIYAAHQADLAMDKAGVGDLILWQRWNRIGGLFFWLGIAGWVFGVIGSAIAKWQRQEAVLFASEGQWELVAAMVILPPVVFMAAMFVGAILL